MKSKVNSFEDLNVYHTALDCEYLTQDQENQLLDQLKTIGPNSAK